MVLVVLITATIVSRSCAAIYSVPIPPHGKVLDETTGLPINNAFIVARFIGDGPHSLIDPGAGTKSRCYGSLVTRSDKNGEYDFAKQNPARLSTKKYKSNQHVDVTAYAPGYSHEINKGYKQWLKRHFVVEKYVEAGLSSVDLSLTPENRSAYPSRFSYLSSLTEVLCGNQSIKTDQHWSMLLSIYEEMRGQYENSRDLVQLLGFCQLINQLGPTRPDFKAIDCSDIQDLIRETSLLEFEKISQIVDDINWGSGPKLELIEYRLMPMNAGVNTFVIPDKPQGVSTQNLAELLKKVCNSDYPGDFVMGSACIYFGSGSIAKRGGNSCHAILRNNILKMNYGLSKGSSIELEPNWCQQKQLPPYNWSYLY